MGTDEERHQNSFSKSWNYMELRMILVSNVAPAFWMWCAEKIMVSLMHSIHISWEQQYYDRGQELYCLCIVCYFYPSHTALSDAPSLLGPSTGSELPETNGNPFQPFINRYPMLRFFFACLIYIDMDIILGIDLPCC